MTTATAPAPGLAPLGSLKPMAVNNLQGRPVPTADALLNRAHRDGLDRGFVIVGFRSEVILAPTAPDNLCIVRATVLMKSLYEEGQPIYEFEGLGDANPETGARVSGRLVSLAETRARTRAIAVALNTDEDVAASGGTPVVMARPATPSFAPPAATAAAAAPQGFAAPAAAAAPQGFVAPSAPGVYQGFKDGIVPFGKHKGKHLTDASISLGDLQFYTRLTMQDRVTPDVAKQADALAEIARRTNTAVPAPASAAPVAFAAPAAAAAPAPMPAQAAAPMPAPMPGANPLPPPPASVPGSGVFPGAAAPQAAPMPWEAAQSVPAAPATVGSGDVARLATLAMTKGYAWPQLAAHVQTAFGVADVALLHPSQLQQLEMQFAALPAVA